MEENELKDKSYLLVQFAEVGSTIMNIQYNNVTPLQLLTLAEYLQVVGKSKLLMEIQERDEQMRQQQLAIPENKIITAHR